MKKSGKILVFSAAMIAAAGLTGCEKTPSDLAKEMYDVLSDNFAPSQNVEPCVYAGPDFYEDYTESDNVAPPVYAGPEFFDDYAGESGGSARDDNVDIDQKKPAT